LNPQFPALDETTSIHDCKTPGLKRLCGCSVDDPVDKLLRDVQIGLLTGQIAPCTLFRHCGSRLATTRYGSIFICARF
jgi:hypothetical protein